MIDISGYSYYLDILLKPPLPIEHKRYTLTVLPFLLPFDIDFMSFNSGADELSWDKYIDR